jgi:hypothetical protein
MSAARLLDGCGRRPCTARTEPVRASAGHRSDSSRAQQLKHGLAARQPLRQYWFHLPFAFRGHIAFPETIVK